MADLHSEQGRLLVRPVGTGTRVLNFIIDAILISIIAFALFRGWEFYVFYYRIYYIESYYFLAMTTFVYYLFFESIWKRTPGKWFSLSKVVNKDGSKPSFRHIFIRSLVRVVGAIVIDSIFLSFINKTLHDYVSGTEVVEI